jgi:hypothetical protein
LFATLTKNTRAWLSPPTSPFSPSLDSYQPRLLLLLTSVNSVLSVLKSPRTPATHRSGHRPALPERYSTMLPSPLAVGCQLSAVSSPPSPLFATLTENTGGWVSPPTSPFSPSLDSYQPRLLLLLTSMNSVLSVLKSPRTPDTHRSGHRPALPERYSTILPSPLAVGCQLSAVSSPPSPLFATLTKNTGGLGTPVDVIPRAARDLLLFIHPPRSSVEPIPLKASHPPHPLDLFHQSPVTSHQSLTSLESALPRNALVTTLECALPKRGT